MKHESIVEAIGNTPVVKIPASVHGLKNIDLYAKLEMMNPFGSLKDRIAWGMIAGDLEEIQRKGQTLIESSSGNTAKALATLASMHGLSFTTITNRINVPEVKKVLQVIGAQIEELPGTSECPDLSDPSNAVATIERRLATQSDKYYHTAQYTNEKNYQTHYETTGPELLADLTNIDYFGATLGTTGSSRGTAEYLKEHNSQTKVIGVISTKRDFIPGIRNADETLEVGIFTKDLYNAVQEVDSLDALDSMRVLIQKSGILAGPTSGASYHGFLEYLKEEDKVLSQRKVAVFIVCDRFEWYLSYIEKRKPEWFGAPQKPNGFRAYTPPTDSSGLSLDAHRAADWLQQEAVLCIDIRGALGFKAGHIAGSINILDRVLTEMLDEGLPFSQDHKLLFVCPSGEASLRFAGYFAQHGFAAKSLAGGLFAWRAANLPLQR